VEMVRHDDIGVKQIGIASIVLKNLLHQYCPSLVAKERPPLSSLRADKKRLSASTDCLSSRSHACPQWLKPLRCYLDGRAKARPLQFGGQSAVPRLVALARCLPAVLIIATSLLPLFHHFSEVAKEVVGVVRSWACLGMVLHAEERHSAMA
jgi:hypothetical protein